MVAAGEEGRLSCKQLLCVNSRELQKLCAHLMQLVGRIAFLVLLHGLVLGRCTATLSGFRRVPGGKACSSGSKHKWRASCSFLES